MPVWLGHTLWRSLRDGGSDFLLQRCGIHKHSAPAKEPVWVHAASVGEVNTVFPLIASLAQRHSQLNFLLTTTTPTGKRVAESAAKTAEITSLHLAYLPLDYNFAVKRFLNKMKPCCVLVVETEIWPCLYSHCNKQSVPMAIINGRLSEKTRRVTRGLAAKTIAPALTSALTSVQLILARSDADASAFEDLLSFTGTTDSNERRPKISNCGNLKQLQLPASAASTLAQSGESASRNFQGRDCCLLASTHDDEELQLVSEWLKLQRDELLVVVPRHPERGKKIEKQIHNLMTGPAREVCRRTLQPNPPAATRVYIADTLGELRQFYASANVSFVGGSLVDVGGHNILEAAQSGCAIVVGPQMYNFKEEMALLQNAKAIQQSDNVVATVLALARLLDNDAEREAQAQAALKVLKTPTGDTADAVLENYLEQLNSFLPDPEHI